MAYLGTPIDTTNQFQSLQGKRFSGDGSTTAFTLDIAPSSTLDIEVFVENVRQDPNSAYTLSGTTLSFTGAPPSGTNNIYVVHQAKAVGTIDVSDSAITTAKLGADAVTAAKIADDAIESEHLNDNIISGQTALTAEPADTDEFLVSDAGTLKRIDYSLIKGGGKIGQVITDTKTDTFSSSATSFTNITGLSVSITPTATTSKVLIILNLGSVGMANYLHLGINDGSSTLTKGAVYGDAGTAQTNNVGLHHLHSPSTTSSITYSAEMRTKSGTAYINRNGSDDAYTQSTSSITVMEVLA